MNKKIIRKLIKENKMGPTQKMLIFLFLLIIGIAGCETLKESKPIMPIEEYEKMLMGRLDANYIGTDNCLAACHYHDKIRREFEASTMGAQMSAKSGLPLINCESCHGPGSLAVEDITEESVAKATEEGYFSACNYDTFIDLTSLPAQAKSLLCLKCHSKNATFKIHNWNAGAHAINDVSCFDCHTVHNGPILITEPVEIQGLCGKCHQQQIAEFSLPSHHPVPEKRIFCNDCHDQHGTVNEKLLVEDTIKETCTRCHAEKEGPFVFEHADNADECNRCHKPHGSVNNNLLLVKEPFLCLQCHATHRTSDTSSAEAKAYRHTRCTDCHSQIHGSDLPSASHPGAFTH
jgi:DmsE family decaheme c-type cytochrome